MSSHKPLSESLSILPDEGTASGLNTARSYTIPPRVKCSVALNVQPSSIPDAGHGLFILKAVKAGELIFAVSKPLVTSVHPEAAKQVCDNCFSTELCLGDTKAKESLQAGRTMKLKTTTDKVLRLTPCTECKRVYYCSKECRLEAWEHHHEVECTELNAVREAIATTFIVPRSVAEYQMILRTTLLRSCNKLSSSEWHELQSLVTRNDYEKGGKNFMKEASLVAESVKLCAVSCIEKVELMDLYYALYRSRLEIRIPLLQIRSDDESCISPSTDFWTAGGFCLDPFAAKINHSCQENIICYFEGPELTVRARRDLAAGEEIFRNYVWYLYEEDIDDVVQRKQELKRGWGIDCKCPGCIGGEVAPTGSLRQRIIAIISKEDPEPVQHSKDLESAIRDMKAAGFGYDTRAMCQLHQQALNGYICENDQQFIKTSLKVFTILFLTTKPPARMFSTERALSTMSDFIQFMYPLSHVYKSAALAKGVKKCLQSCYLPWFDFYIEELKNLFGRHAAVVRAATKVFDNQLKEIPEYVPMSQDNPSRRRDRRDTFLLQLNILLAWAELPPRAKGDVFKS